MEKFSDAFKAYLQCITASTGVSGMWAFDISPFGTKQTWDKQIINPEFIVLSFFFLSLT